MLFNYEDWRIMQLKMGLAALALLGLSYAVSDAFFPERGMFEVAAYLLLASLGLLVLVIAVRFGQAACGAAGDMARRR